MKRFRSILFPLVATLLFGAASAHAYLLAVEVLWGSDYAQSPYNLNLGSIIQLVAYDSTGTGTTSWDHNAPEENFTPYGADAYIPDTTPDGHHIVGSGSLQALTEYGPGVYGMTAIINVPDAYDTVYVRVFSATDFDSGVLYRDINWGISDPNHIDPVFGTALTWFDDVQAPNVANFEVIPEPSSLSFLLSGGCGMGVFSLFRRRRKLRPPEE